MPKQLCLSAVVELPDDMFLAANLISRLSAPWQALLNDLSEGDVRYQARVEELEVRAKPATNGTGAKRGRKPKQAPEAQPEAGA